MLILVYVKHAFSKWRQSRDEAVIYKLKFSQASIHHERKLLMHSLLVWKQAVTTSKQQRVCRLLATLNSSIT